MNLFCDNKATIVFEIYEAYLSKQVAAAQKGSAEFKVKTAAVEFDAFQVIFTTLYYETKPSFSITTPTAFIKSGGPNTLCHPRHCCRCHKFSKREMIIAPQHEQVHISCQGKYNGDDRHLQAVPRGPQGQGRFSHHAQPASFSDTALSMPLYPLLPLRPFCAMFENEMEESLSGTIKTGDVSYGTLHAFVNYLYTAEVGCLDQQLACDLLVMADKYQVQHLKDLCQKFLVSNLNWDNSLSTYTFAHQHNAKQIINLALTLITGNMDKLTTREEYAFSLKEKDPRLVFGIYDACETICFLRMWDNLLSNFQQYILP
ncbi:unnamed protein product [Prunus brigantina]